MVKKSAKLSIVFTYGTRMTPFSTSSRTKKCRRVHIGNLPINVGLTPDALKQFINTVMQQMFLTVKPGEPVIDSFVSSDGKFGFVEMRTIQEATNALSMTGADCFGRY